MSRGKKPKFEEAQEHIGTTLREETDRGCVLVAGGRLDSKLEDSIRLAMSKLSKQPSSSNTASHIDWLFSRKTQGPLTSFHTKIVLACALGVIGNNTTAALMKFKDLRNHFAHHPNRVTLTVARVNSIVDAMNKQCRDYVNEVDERMPVVTEHSPARRRCVAAIFALIMAINHQMD